MVHNFAIVAQLVEHRPSKSGVAGSSPVYRSINRSLTFKKKLLSPRLTAGQLPLKEFIEVRILGGQLKNFFLKKFGKWKTLSYLCIVIEGKGDELVL